MLRDPDSVYVSKRDKSLKKVKLFYDAEARVVGYEGGKVRLCALLALGRACHGLSPDFTLTS